jgi:hypothetical protein
MDLGSTAPECWCTSEAGIGMKRPDAPDISLR